MDYEAEEHDDVIGQDSENLEAVLEQEMVGEVVMDDEDVEDEYIPVYAKPSRGQKDKIIIMGKMSAEYTDWVEKELPE